MSVAVAKFGGTSLASAEQFRKVMAILRADESRRFVVPSAPGKRTSADEKITDMLYACHKQAASGGNIKETFAAIRARYEEIVRDLQLSLDLSGEFAAIEARIPKDTADYAASRGEYLNGLIMAAALSWDFVDPAECIRFTADGRFDEETTQELLSARLKKSPRAVVPGFYGAKPDGSVKTFSRGGSDVTGAIVARAAYADVYENWTDVSGFMMADPRVVKDPQPIRVITYRELRELSYMGATVLHEDAIFPVRQAGIPIHIKNTNAPQDPGTAIVRTGEGACVAPRGSITGIAGRKGFTVIAIEKAMMNAELGFGHRVLGVFTGHGISFEHLPTGIDTMSVVVSDKALDGKLDAVLRDLQTQIEPDSIHVETGLALVATVGRGMERSTGTAARLFAALADAGVNVRMIDQGSSEINIIVGVDDTDFEKAMNAIYRKFVSLG